MVIGVPKEIKSDEGRVALTPTGVKVLTGMDHTVLVQSEAGLKSGYSDEAYRSAGAHVATADQVYSEADMVVKVKEPIASEYQYLREGLILFCYLHLASDLDLTLALRDSNTIAIAYETVEDTHGELPLLIPMSEIAGRMAVQAGIHYMESPHGGRGILVSGVPGVRPGRVTVIGAGVVGGNSTRMAVGLGADVTVIDRDARRLRYMDDLYGGRVKTLLSDEDSIASAVKESDLLIGAVLVKGAKAPNLVSRSMVRSMAQGSLIVDVSIDQGGCIETTGSPTTHSNPIRITEGVNHYGVANMPGCVPRTSTMALTGVTLPYICRLANLGVDSAIQEDPGLAMGVNVRGGAVVYSPVAEAHNLL